MAILIPNIDKPRSCMACPCFDDEIRSCNVIRRFFGKSDGFDFCDSVHPNCPLVEVKVDVETFTLLQEMSARYDNETVQRAFQIAEQQKEKREEKND